MNGSHANQNRMHSDEAYILGKEYIDTNFYFFFVGR